MQLVFNSVQEVLNFVASLREAQPSQNSQTTQKSQASTQSQASNHSKETTQKTQSPASQENPNTASEKQIKLIFILLKKLGVSEKEVRLNLISNIVGRRINSFSQLNKTEATKIIKELSDKVPA